jgi:hypothetical protein
MKEGIPKWNRPGNMPQIYSIILGIRMRSSLAVICLAWREII